MSYARHSTRSQCCTSRPAKEVPTVERLAEDSIAFLASHAAAKGSAVFYAFTSQARSELPATSGPLLTKGDCLEYFLKALAVALNKSLCKGEPNYIGLRLNVSHSRVMWAIRQLRFMWYIEFQEFGYNATAFGRRALWWVNKTGLSLASSGFLAGTESITPSEHMYWFLALAVVSELAPSIVRPKSGDGEGRLTTRQYLDLEALLEGQKEDSDEVTERNLLGDAWVNLLALAYARDQESPSWEVNEFDLGSRIELMRERGLDVQAVPFTMRAFNDLVKDFLYAKTLLTWFRAHMFNVAFIGAMDNDRQWATDILEAFDLCSTRFVRVDPRALMDLEPAWHHIKDENPRGVWVVYSRMSRVTVGDRTMYQISELMPLSGRFVSQTLGQYTGGQQVPSTVVFGSTLRTPPYSREFSHYLT